MSHLYVHALHPPREPILQYIAWPNDCMSEYPTRSDNVTRPLPKRVEESAHARILRRAGAQAEWPKGPRVGASKAEEPWNADTNYFVTISLPHIHASSSPFIILERREGRPLPSRSLPLLFQPWAIFVSIAVS